ncbi:MAG: hypothetical protein ACRCWD_01430 [Culicoidibacterales bacterium]
MEKMATFTNENEARAQKQDGQTVQTLTAKLTIENYQRLVSMNLEQLSYLQHELQQMRQVNRHLEQTLNEQAKSAYHDKDDLRAIIDHLQQQTQLLQVQNQMLKGTIYARESAILTLQQEKNLLEQHVLQLNHQFETEERYHYHEKSDWIQRLEEKVRHIDELREKLRYQEQELQANSQNQVTLESENEQLLREMAQLQAEIQKQVLHHWHEQNSNEPKKS